MGHPTERGRNQHGRRLIRTVAGLAGASPQRASVVVAHLVAPGVVARRESGSSALVWLERWSTAARMVLARATPGVSDGPSG